MDDNQLDFSLYGVAPPESIPHYTPEEMESFKIPVKREWKQKGNTIYREGEEAVFVTQIPTHKILTGTDENGHPILIDVKT